MTDKKITQLTAMTTPSDDDIFPIVDAPGTTPTSKKITWANIKSALFGSGIQVQGVFTPTSGAGIELIHTGGISYMFSYDRTGGTYMPFVFRGSTFDMRVANTSVIGASAGFAVTASAAINYAADAGSSDTYAITLDPALVAYRTGLQIIFKANTANTGAATININSLGAKTIVKGVSTTLANNDILAAMFCNLIYDGTNFVLLNPRTL